MTDTKRILELADHLESQVPWSQFEMSCFIQSPTVLDPTRVPLSRMQNECGTAACIAGWAVLLFGEPSKSVVEMAKEAGLRHLDIDLLATYLLVGTDFYRPLDRLFYNFRDIKSPQDAARRLRTLAWEMEHGVVSPPVKMRQWRVEA